MTSQRIVKRLREIVVASLIAGLGLAAAVACAIPKNTAIGHSYTPSTSSQYVPRDDDGDIKEVSVNVIASLNDEGKQARQLAHTIEQVSINAQYRAAQTHGEQIEQVYNAVNSRTRVIVIPQDALTRSQTDIQSWVKVLQYARKKGIVVLINSRHGLQMKDIAVDPLYWAAYWNISAQPQEADMSVVDVMISVVEDRPHNRTLTTQLKDMEKNDD
ncbi:hypothetical protein [Alloscardovia omnicolens]|uniref:hypothetical protein n=1 Tax=Alloscardovia omnicolens TaxID=419015 RepID=UPI003A615EC4